MNDHQLKYEELCSEIRQVGLLGENDRMLFYKLHQEVITKDNLTMRYMLSTLRDQKRYNEHYILSQEERSEIFEILEQLRQSEGLDRYEYRYLTFLVARYGFRSSASLPCIPKITDTNLADFEDRFAFNQERKGIYEIFKAGLKRCFELYQLEELEVLVGGSFANLEKELPKDIDPLIVLPRQQWHNDRKHHILNKIIQEFQRPDKSNTFDLHKILSDIPDEHYMRYELMTLMGNTPESKIESGIRDMKFKCKELFRLKLRIEALRAGPAQRRGGALVRVGKHQAALIFLVLFSSKEKRTKELPCLTPLKFW